MRRRIEWTTTVSPPYVGIEKWIEKALQEYGKNNIDSAVLLLPNQIDTPWMARLDPYTRVVIREPVTIVNERTGMKVSSTQIPLVIVYIGSEEAKFVATFSDLGTAFQRVLP